MPKREQSNTTTKHLANERQRRQKVTTKKKIWCVPVSVCVCMMYERNPIMP